MKINLRKVVQEIREAWQKGGDAAVSGRGGKSSAYSWSYRVGQEYLPDATPAQITKIAKGEATLRWVDNKVEFVETPSPITMLEENAGSQAAHRFPVVKRCTCPPPLKVSSWNGQTGHVVQRDPDCQIHGAEKP